MSSPKGHVSLREKDRQLREELFGGCRTGDDGSVFWNSDPRDLNPFLLKQGYHDPFARDGLVTTIYVLAAAGRAPVLCYGLARSGQPGQFERLARPHQEGLCDIEAFLGQDLGLPLQDPVSISILDLGTRSRRRKATQLLRTDRQCLSIGNKQGNLPDQVVRSVVPTLDPGQTCAYNELHSLVQEPPC